MLKFKFRFVIACLFCMKSSFFDVVKTCLVVQIMASSLNGLTVGDPLPENLMESPARSEGMLYLRLILV